MAETAGNKKLFSIQLIAVAVGLFLLVAKFVAYFLTHSNTILTDALESIINVVAGTFALYSLYLSGKPKDADHPYGHGKVEFISAGFEGVLISIAGLAIIVKSAIAFFNPRTLENLDTGLIIIAVSGVVNFALGYYLRRVGEKEASLTLKADGEHLLSDAYSSFGILAGLVLILCTGWVVLDNVVAILFGCLICFTGIKLMRKSVAGIMDEADEKIIDEIIKHLSECRKPEWIDIHNLRIIQYGNKLHIDCHATLPWYYTLEQAHTEMEEIAAVVNAKHAAQLEFFIHGDPCVAESCKICSLADCPVRQEAYKYSVEWSLENLVKNKKHGL